MLLDFHGRGKGEKKMRKEKSPQRDRDLLEKICRDDLAEFPHTIKIPCRFYLLQQRT